jgi:L,D-peptidoglycan transpeptidase YkuD (ErfK/YbiS/YcfS/YnhG family)
MRLTVETDRRLLHGLGDPVPCTIGKGGACAAADKREGDGRTPWGHWPVRTILLRPDRGFAPPPAIAWRWLRPGDGWSDDPADPAYNSPVRHPHLFSAEHLWREDDRYDVVVILGHNDTPPVLGLGSAIFLHLRGAMPTEGCVAIAPDVMRRLLQALEPGAILDIRQRLGDAPSLV